MQEINLIFGARNGEFRITAIMLNKNENLFSTLNFKAVDFFL